MGALCSLELTLYDGYGNLLNQAGGLLEARELNTIIVGPYENLDGAPRRERYVEDPDPEHKHLT